MMTLGHALGVRCLHEYEMPLLNLLQLKIHISDGEGHGV